MKCGQAGVLRMRPIDGRRNGAEEQFAEIFAESNALFHRVCGVTSAAWTAASGLCPSGCSSSLRRCCTCDDCSSPLMLQLGELICSCFLPRCAGLCGSPASLVAALLLAASELPQLEVLTMDRTHCFDAEQIDSRLLFANDMTRLWQLNSRWMDQEEVTAVQATANNCSSK